MAHRHVASLFQPLASSSSVVAIIRLASCTCASSRLYSHQARRSTAIRHGSVLKPNPTTGVRTLRFASSSAAADRRQDEIQAEEAKDSRDDIWNMPPPPSPPSSSSDPAGVYEQESAGRALPVPDNTGTTSPSTDTERAAAGASSAAFDEELTRSSESRVKKERSHEPELAESSIPNYPTLPASSPVQESSSSSSASSSSSSLPKLATPNIGLSGEGTSSRSSTDHPSSSPPSASSTYSPAQSSTQQQQTFDFAALSASLRSTSQKLRTSIPPEVQAKVLGWSSAVLSHSKRVAKDTEKRLVELGLKVNQMTGYQEVERLKGLVFAKEDNLQTLREAARSAKEAYDQAVASRSSAQRDVNTLLERKHSWTDSDVMRFTSLVRADHASTHAVSSTSVALKEAELAVDKAFSELMQTILQRYHEEQVWSDKIRSVSTWANLIGLALNAVIFLGAVVFVEPWKRRRLVERLEERVAGMMERVEGRLGGLEGNLKEFAVGAQAAAVSHGAPSEDTVGGVLPASIGEVDPIPVIEGEVELLPSLDIEDGLSRTLPEDADADSTTESMTDNAQIRPELDSPLLDPIIPSTRPAQTRVPAIPTSTALFSPLVTTTIDNLPAYLDPLAKPSQERDLVLAGLAGAAIMGIVMGIGRAVFS
ncbi:hypothetical protein IAU59_002191 [Kwoniella sp. CBS 9459]